MPLPLVFESPRSIVTAAVFLVVGCLTLTTRASEPTEQELQQTFERVVRPFVEHHCIACHGKNKREAKLDLSDHTTVSLVSKHHRIWATMLHRLEAKEMPPEEADRQPTADQRQAIIQWIRAFRSHDVKRHAGDPGPVLARRLSNAEYDNTIRDLTGVDIRPTREFPIDPANEAGFDNSGESLAMSPDLLNKYLAASRFVADHIVLKPYGFEFAPHAVVTETDRDKYCVQRIIEFYQRQRKDLADYFLAAWRFLHRDALGMGAATLDELATQQRLSAPYLAKIWSTLTESQHNTGPLAELRIMWRDLPAPDPAQLDAARQGCERMRDFVVRERGNLKEKIANLTVRGISTGSQPLVLWKNRQYAANHTRYTGKLSSDANDAALHHFCEVFPDAFYVSERGRIFLAEEEKGRGRLLSAGFHLMVGYFRDDRPLCELILNEPGRRELDSLWQELDFITFAPLRQYKDFIFFERAEPPRFMEEAKFDFARSEDKDSVSDAKISRLAELYLAKAREHDASREAIEAIEHYFAHISSAIRWVEQSRLAAEPSHLEALQDFAERAYRRPLSPRERDELLTFYRALRTQDALDHEDAVRDTVVSILMSPHFCYRINVPKTGIEAQPLSNYSLASRLSYFLWASMPDAELMRHAAAGDLADPEVLVRQVRRMMRNERVRGMATEFGGNWLDFRAFEQHNAVDRERFGAFTNELREAMFEEPVRFFVDVARENRSVLDFLYADHTFVNPVLARHYGVPSAASGVNEWVIVDHAREYGRGGLLPMSVFLTKNAPGLRTSPVKRGYWVVRRLLGEIIPAPPPEVPELPKDEAKLGELTLRQLLARHREHKSCAGCHDRFDAIGLAFEGYGPIGERREHDLGGRPVDSRATLPGGGEGEGLDGLRLYLRERRQDEFLDNLCRKLLAYALGRGWQLADQAALDEMRSKLAANEFRFGSLVEAIVTSPVFLNQRGRDYDMEQ